MHLKYSKAEFWITSYTATAAAVVVVVATAVILLIYYSK